MGIIMDNRMGQGIGGKDPCEIWPKVAVVAGKL
jgi:hypothetical protein